MISDRSNQANQKQVSSLVGRALLENAEHCTKCNDLTDISKLNIAKGTCSACSKVSVDKLRELLKRGLE